MNRVVEGAVAELDSKFQHMTDADIIWEIKMGRRSGDALFYLLFARYAEMLQIIYSKQSQSLMDFDDFMLELDIRLFKDDCKALKAFNPEKASFKTYLSTIARNLLFDLREQEMPTLDVEEVGKSLPTHADAEEVMWLIEEINTFPNKDARYVLLKTIEGYKSKEIADMLTSRKHEEGTLDEKDSLKPSYIDTLRSRALKTIKTSIYDKRPNLYESECMEAPSMSIRFEECNICFFNPRSFRSNQTSTSQPDYANFFIQHIMGLYHEMLEY